MEVCSEECKSDCGCEDDAIEDEINTESPVEALAQKSSSGHPSSKSVAGHTPPSTWDFTNWNNPKPSAFSTHAKGFNDFAQGGHKESDRALARRAEETAAKAFREKQDMDQFDALFGGSSKPPQPEKKGGPKVLRVATDEHGATRTLYQEKYTITQPEVRHAVDKKENIDLLDL